MAFTAGKCENSGFFSPEEFRAHSLTLIHNLKIILSSIH